MKTLCTRLTVLIVILMLGPCLASLKSQMINKWDEIVSYPVKSSTYSETGEGLAAADTAHFAAIVNINTTTYDPLYVVRSDDGGKTWKKILDKSDDEAYLNDHWLYILYPSPELIILTGYVEQDMYSLGSFMMITSDSGKTWTRSTFEHNSCLVGPDMYNSKIGAVCSQAPRGSKDNFLLTTKDGWKSYKVGSLPKNTFDCRQVDFIDSNTFVVNVSDDTTNYNYSFPERHLYVTTDFGQTWSKLPQAMFDPFFKFKFTSKTTGYAINYNADKKDPNSTYVAKTTDGGQSWTTVPGLGNWLSDIDCADSLNVIVAYSNMILHTTDGGQSWNKEYPTVKSDPLKHFYIKYVKFINPNTALAATNNLNILKLDTEKVLAPPDIFTSYKQYHDPDSVDVQWEPISGADKYNLQLIEVDTTMKVEDIIQDADKYMVLNTDLSDTLYHFESLTYNKSYLVRAKSKNSSQESDWSNYIYLQTKDITGVEDCIRVQEGKITIYPNPALGKCIINTGNHGDDGIIKIYNDMGMEMQGLKINMAGGGYGIAELDVSCLPEGSYFVKYQQGGRVLVSRFVVLRSNR